MTALPELHPTRCAICGTLGEATERWPATLTPEAFTTATFSARRLPDRVHYRMVRCDRCGLLRSDPVIDPSALAALYATSTFDYSGELGALQRTYGGALARIERRLTDGRRDGLADIGAGNGFVLDAARARGWTGLVGVEPSSDAIAHATPQTAPLMVQAMMGPGVLPEGQLSAITLFQVLDHLPDPLALLQECRRALSPGGVILAWNHNASALSARLLGARSPIVDVEHTYLYDPGTMRQLFTAAGFTQPQVSAVWNRYSLRYLAHLLPLPGPLKRGVLAALAGSLGRPELRVPLGNLCLTAINPGD